MNQTQFSMFKRFEQLPRRESELTECLYSYYCRNLLPAKSREHIFNASWGGCSETNNLICAECNDSFSHEIDLAFDIYVKTVMNAWGFKGERHKQVPTIDLGNEYFLDQGAKLKLKRPLIENELSADNKVRSNLTFNSKTQAKRWIEDGMNKWLGRPPSEIEKDAFRKIIRESKTDKLNAKPQQKSTKLNLQQQYRSTAHTILKCLGIYAPEWVQKDSTRPIREFARNSLGDWQNFAVMIKQSYSISEQVIDILGLGVHHNSVEIYWDSSTGMVIGVLTILNRIKRAIVLANNYSGPDSVLYIAENTYPSKEPLNSVFVEFDKNQSFSPLLSICYFTYSKNTLEYFFNEINTLTQSTYPRDAVVACLIKSIEAKNRENQRINQTSIKEYMELFLTFFLDLGKSYGIDMDSEKIYSTLLKHGFDNIQNQSGEKLFTDSTVESLMASALKETLKCFDAGLLSK